MIQEQIKLKLRPKQEATLMQWILSLKCIWNWGVRKIELDAKDGIYYPKLKFCGLLAGHGPRIGVPAECIQVLLKMVWDTWSRCFKKIGKKPHLKGVRRPLTSIPFQARVKRPENGRIKIPVLGAVRYHKKEIREGNIKCMRIVKRASGWFLCLFIDAEPRPIEHKGDEKVGIDPGYRVTLALSSGENICVKKEFDLMKKRLAQAQRGGNKKLVARIHERIKNKRKDFQHKISKKLVEENSFIAFSKDTIKSLSKDFGRAVAEASHYRLRTMLKYKCAASGRTYIEVPGAYSTVTCSNCFAKTGPKGKKRLNITKWICSECGSAHDREQNSAIITLIDGLGMHLQELEKKDEKKKKS